MSVNSGLKGNPNSQGILNWIIQILHYYYSKQHKNIENSQIIEQNLIFSLSVLLSVYCSLHFLCLPSSRVFSVLGHRYSAKLNITSDHSQGTWFFSKLSLAKYQFLHKKPVFTVTSIHFTSCLQLSEET